MQFVSLGMGYFFASPVLSQSGLAFLMALLGTGLLSGGAAACNHLMEWRLDAAMDRTKNRPIPAGKVSKIAAWMFAVVLTVLGFLCLYYGSGALPAYLGLLTAGLYVGVYTPAKRLSWLNTYVGTIPGAIPPLAGWAVATGHLDWPPFMLAAILAIWQLPHFFAIAWMYQEDYDKGGFIMLPKLDPTGSRTVFQIIFHTALLTIVSLAPVYAGFLGWIYMVGALGLGIWFFKKGLIFANSKTKADAKGVLKASVYYLPILLMFMVLDRLIL
jgi:protoheme IX farnesyltransferase